MTKLSISAALAAALAAPFAALADDAPKAESIVLHFDSGSSAIRAQDAAQLDKASRTYRDGNPIVMIVTGSSDATGAPDANLTLSEKRANAVVAGLVARGIPVQKLQVLGKGVSETAASGAPDEQARRAEITWR